MHFFLFPSLSFIDTYTIYFSFYFEGLGEKIKILKQASNYCSGWENVYLMITQSSFELSVQIMKLIRGGVFHKLLFSCMEIVHFCATCLKLHIFGQAHEYTYFKPRVFFSLLNHSFYLIMSKKCSLQGSRFCNSDYGQKA